MQFMEQHQAAAVAAYPAQAQAQQQQQRGAAMTANGGQQQQQGGAASSLWNKDLPLLDKSTLQALLKQFLTPGKTHLTDVERAHFDKFLLPHSWDADYVRLYGDLASFAAQVSGGAGEARQVVVTPMPTAAARKKGRGKK